MSLDAMLERHFSPRTLAEVWGYSEDTILRWFADQDGVLRAGEQYNSRRRTRCEIRIPESVARRVYAERTKSKV